MGIKTRILLAAVSDFTNELYIEEYWDITPYSALNVSEKHIASIFRVEE
jgi:hypothetical protein